MLFYPADESAAELIPDPSRRTYYQKTRAILRRVIGLRLQCEPAALEFKIASGGKPYIEGCEFSISHSGPWFIVATSESPIGVDIETHIPKRNAMELATRFFAFSDVAALRLIPERKQKSDFIRLWVAKEAALKAAGTGLSGYLFKAECVFNEQAICAVHWDNTAFSIHEFVLKDGTPGALAWQKSREVTITWRDSTEIIR